MKAAIQMIREADRGKLMVDLQQGVEDIVTGIEDARGAGVGEITIKLKISSPSAGTYEIASALSVKVPQPKRSKTLMFLNEDGDLQREDPRQPVLPSVVGADELNRRRGPVLDQ